ncbi:hypothetical protein ACKLNO_01400 [Neisseriaceae bacterium B1]
MKKIFLLLTLSLTVNAFAYNIYEEWTEDYEYNPKAHYSINNRIYHTYNNRPAPCNYANVPALLDCYSTEVSVINSFFQHVPNKMKAKGFSAKQIALFRKEQALFEKRTRRYCDRQDALHYSKAQGSGSGMLYQNCFYDQYHPRFLKLKKMLGESHPVKLKQK